MSIYLCAALLAAIMILLGICAARTKAQINEIDWETAKPAVGTVTGITTHNNTENVYRVEFTDDLGIKRIGKTLPYRIHSRRIDSLKEAVYRKRFVCRPNEEVDIRYVITPSDKIYVSIEKEGMELSGHSGSIAAELLLPFSVPFVFFIWQIIQLHMK